MTATDCVYKLSEAPSSNNNCKRYILNNDDVLNSCEIGYSLGFRTFVLQGGEGAVKTSDICKIVYNIKSRFTDCAVTLSLGEYEYDDYKSMFEAGADRYLLRHETADENHYKLLHPSDMSFERRMNCLKNLKDIGFQVGCGFMVGSPFQTAQTIAKDLKFIETFSPDMCGIGPFIPHDDTPFKDYSAGSVAFTCTLLSIIRLIKPNILLPATTALGSLEVGGREKGILAGANVIMPNLSPESARKNYTLYNGKLSSGAESAEGLEILKKNISSIGYRIVTDRGDIKTNYLL